MDGLSPVLPLLGHGPVHLEAVGIVGGGIVCNQAIVHRAVGANARLGNAVVGDILRVGLGGHLGSRRHHQIRGCFNYPLAHGRTQKVVRAAVAIKVPLVLGKPVFAIHQVLSGVRVVLIPHELRIFARYIFFGVRRKAHLHFDGGSICPIRLDNSVGR